MTSDLPQSAPQPPMSAPSSGQTKVRIRFRKDGDLRFVSHHDLMKVFERMFRRAALPVAQTKGFHPTPRMVFASSLALGILGCEEVLELVLDAPRTPQEVQQALAQQTPPGLTILSVKAIDKKLTGQARIVCYRLSLSGPPDADLPRRIRELFQAAECWVERTRPNKRRIDVRPLLRTVHLQPAHLEIELWVTPTGAARPGEVLGLLGLTSLLDAGAVLERTRLELHDETQETGPLPQPKEIRGDDLVPPGPPSRPTALLPGPLSFDS